MGPGVPYEGGCPRCGVRHGKAQGGQAFEEPHSRHLCLCQLHPSFQSSHLSISTHLCGLVPCASPFSLL